jgi:hypothetical protein
VDPHVLGEAAGLVAIVDRLFGASQPGRSMSADRPAAFASLAIVSGAMSGVPTICSCSRLSCTVEVPSAPITIAATPKTISTVAAIGPSDLEPSSHPSPLRR